ncbi:MAG: WhiB family transcriptional regulator [Actinomycetales bacterium]|nr:WhiB family transcriptional regulator [Actinomycetales bacterium]
MSTIGPTLTPQTPEWGRLGHVLEELRAAGTITPCREGMAWTSEDERARAAAVLACRGCPALAACHAAAESTGERFGVWAGRDRTPRARAGQGAA